MTTTKHKPIKRCILKTPNKAIKLNISHQVHIYFLQVVINVSWASNLICLGDRLVMASCVTS